MMLDIETFRRLAVALDRLNATERRGAGDVRYSAAARRGCSVKRLVPEKAPIQYRQLWRVVDGAVADALSKHPIISRRKALAPVRPDGRS